MIATFDQALVWIAANPARFFQAVQIHLALSAAGLGLAMALALPVGFAFARHQRLGDIAVAVAGVGRTVPGLAVLALCMPLFGTGFWPSVIALALQALAPVLLNAVVGLRSVDGDVVDAARGMGMGAWRILWRIELPLALPLISAGIRIAAVQTVAGATLATFIGGGGLGDFITTGVSIMDFSRLLVGAVPVTLLAILTELMFGGIERWFTRHARAG
ncbi:MAG: ABC transporter permease [Alphaproteobacteria bacterium]|nr:ABC transporter permease [Alphaproteobacteria bacterium]